VKATGCSALVLLIAALFPITTSSAATPPITDPQAFVTEIYRLLVANENYVPGRALYSPPEDIYTPRLAALFADYRRRTRGYVGCWDIVFWVNGQDWLLKNVRVSSHEITGFPDRKEVIATFLNSGTPEELHFDFREISGAWLLNDVRSVKEFHYNLSEALRCR
jgi:hypothetical protein